ncbi:MAG: phosphatidate cytidylyltransferase [Bacilli bacterium]|jgi:phosphatidate cytidylyltransferase
MNNNLKIVPNELNSEAKASMKSRIITSIILALICFPCAFLGGWFYFGLIFICVGLATHEIVSVERKRRFSLFIYVFCFVIMYALIYWIFIKNQVGEYRLNPSEYQFAIETGFENLSVSTIAVAVAAGVFFIVVLANDKFTIHDASYLFTMIVIIALGMQALLFMRYYPYSQFAFGSLESTVDTTTPIFKYFHSALLLFYLIIGVIVNDIGAYFIGVLFGRNKMNPRISPKKTWEGFFGGIVLSFALSLTFAFLVAEFKMPILPFLTKENWYWIVLISLAMPIICNLGDFTFSSVKRYYEIKDFGRILKGHGGVLDRLDSALFAAIAVAILIIFINNGWNFFL